MILKCFLEEREKTKLNLVAAKRLVNKCNCLSTTMNGILCFFFIFLLADFYYIWKSPTVQFYFLISFCSHGSSTEATRLTTGWGNAQFYFSWNALEKFIFAHTFALITRRFLCLSHFISLSPHFQRHTRRCMAK